MSESHPRFWSLFFELYEGLPRQGPGNRASAAQALALCQGLPSSPAVLDLRGHFTLPDEAWWDEFYTPMERRIAELRVQNADDTEAIAVPDQLAQEPEMHRRNADCHAYEFFVARRGRL